MTEEEWDEKLLAECIFKNNTRNGAKDLERVTVDGPQACAELTLNTPGGLFWVFNQGNAMCIVKSSEREIQENGRMAGNRNCGLLSQNQWDQILGKTTTPTR